MMPTLPNQRTLRPQRLMAFAAAMVLPVVGAFAQSIPDEMVGKNDISPADRQQMKAAIDANKAGLTGGPVEIKKSRDVLVAPLEKNGVSVPFRVAYANALIEAANLKELAKSDKDLVAANALRIAGQAATGTSLEIAVGGLKDPRPQVRMAAAVAIRAAFAAARNSPALSQEELNRAMRALAEHVAGEAEPGPIDASLQAMVAAREITGFRSRAIEYFSNAAGRRAMTLAKSDKAIDLTPLLRVAGPARQEMTEKENLTPEARKAAAAFAGQTLIAVQAAWKDGTDPDPSMIQTAKAASAVLALVSDSTVNVGDLVASGNGKQEAFRAALAKIVGPGGVLQSEPFKIPADQLKP